MIITFQLRFHAYGIHCTHELCLIVHQHCPMMKRLLQFNPVHVFYNFNNS